jgi:hypothetical protein
LIPRCRDFQEFELDLTPLYLAGWRPPNTRCPVAPPRAASFFVTAHVRLRV